MQKIVSQKSTTKKFKGSFLCLGHLVGYSYRQYFEKPQMINRFYIFQKEHYMRLLDSNLTKKKSDQSYPITCLMIARVCGVGFINILVEK